MKKIALSGKYGKDKFALVDDEDFDELNKYKWRCTSDGYVKRSTTIKTINGERKDITIYMARFIANTPLGLEADHEDTNTLNNQKYNLRNCTRSENEHNKNKAKTNTSGYKGVSYDKSRNKWVASIMVAGKTIFIGRFDNDIEAAIEYNKSAIEHHGKFAKLNEV
jgi:hypothetical protein